MGFAPYWLNDEVIGWAMFDFANQAFTMVMITVMYQDYFINHVVPLTVDGKNDPGKRLWETCNMTATAALIVLSPLLGALADFTGKKRAFLFVTYVGCVTANLLLGFVYPGNVAAGMWLFIVGYIFFGAGENFLNAFLPEISMQKDMGKVSAFSWTIAYCGSLISMLVAVLIVMIVPGPAGYRWVSFWCGMYFLLAGIPSFMFLKEHKQPEILLPGQSLATIGFQRMMQTFHEMRQYTYLFRFFVIAMIYTAGMQVVIFYAGTITKELFHFDQTKSGIFLLVMILSGVLGTVVTGLFQDRLGTKWTVMLWLAVWSVTMIVAGGMRHEWQFWIVGNFVGLAMGALGSSSRAMAGLFSPEHKSGEFFGFYGMAQKLAVILGLGTQFVLGKWLHADFKTSIGASAVFFVAGLLLMFTISERGGRIAALRATRRFRHRQWLQQHVKSSSPPAQ